VARQRSLLVVAGKRCALTTSGFSRAGRTSV